MPAAETYVVSLCCVVFSSFWFGCGNLDNVNSGTDEVAEVAEFHTMTVVKEVQDSFSLQGLVKLMMTLCVAVSCWVVWRHLSRLRHTPAPQRQPLPSGVDLAAAPRDIVHDFSDEQAVHGSADVVDLPGPVLSEDARVLRCTSYHRPLCDRVVIYTAQGPQVFRPRCASPDDNTVTRWCSLSSQSLPEKLPVISLTWSSSGSLLAVSHGRRSHSSVCKHRASLCVWNIGDIDPDVELIQPDVTFSPQSCVLSIEFDPEQSTVLAGGSICGKVYFWSMNLDLLAESEAECGPITEVKWKDESLLLAISLDGQMLVWQFQKNSVNMIQRVYLLTEIPTSAPKRKGQINEPLQLLSFSLRSKSSFVIGCANGSLHFFSNVTSTTTTCCIASTSQSSEKYLRKFTYTSNNKPIFSVQASPFSELFISINLDAVRIYSYSKKEPVFSIRQSNEQAWCAKWSPKRPTVIACGMDNGSINIEDLAKRRPSGTKLYANHTKSPIHCLCFSPERLLAAGDGEGNVTVWHLSKELVEKRTDEEDVITNLDHSGRRTDDPFHL